MNKKPLLCHVTKIISDTVKHMLSTLRSHDFTAGTGRPLAENLAVCSAAVCVCEKERDTSACVVLFNVNYVLCPYRR